MTNPLQAQDHLFESSQIRSVWDEAQGEWYFAVVDVVAALYSGPQI